jgi:hypothetical protein
LEAEKKGYYEKICFRMAGICLGSDYDPLWLIRWIHGQIFRLGILKLPQSRIGCETRMLPQAVIGQTGQRKGQQGAKREKIGSGFLEVSFHFTLRGPSAFAWGINP